MTKEYPWMLGPFEKAAEANPCLVPNTVSRFFCPVQEKELGWEAKDVFNPAAVVKDDRVYLLYRAEDHEGKYAGTSRIGLAVSDDGLHFTTMPEPVLYPETERLHCSAAQKAPISSTGKSTDRSSRMQWMGNIKASGQNPAQLSAGRRVTTFIRSSSRKPTGCTGEKVTFMLPPPMI